MKMTDEDYTLSVLKMVVNTDLDNNISTSIQDLESLESNRDQIVWEIATRIYTHSGHKIGLPMVRDLVDARIRDIKHQLAKEHHNLRERAARRTAPVPTEVDSTRRIFVKVCSVICGCTEISANQVSMSSQINDLVDRHEFSKILMNLEEAFEIKIPDEAAGKMQTVEHAVDFISRQRQKQSKLSNMPLTSLAVR